MRNAHKNQHIQSVFVEKVPCAFAKAAKTGGYGTHYISMMLDPHNNIVHLTNECADQHDHDCSEAAASLSQHTCSFVLTQLRRVIEKQPVDIQALPAGFTSSGIWRSACTLSDKIANKRASRTSVRRARQNRQAQEATKYTAILKHEQKRWSCGQFNLYPDDVKQEIVSAEKKICTTLTKCFAKALNTAGLFEINPVSTLDYCYKQQIEQALDTAEYTTAVPRAALQFSTHGQYFSRNARAPIAVRMSDGTWLAFAYTSPYDHRIVPITGAKPVQLDCREFLISPDTAKRLHVGHDAESTVVQGHKTWMKETHWARHGESDAKRNDQIMKSGAAHHTCVVCRKKFTRIQRHLSSEPHYRALNAMALHGLRYTTKQGLSLMRRYSKENFQYHGKSVTSIMFDKKE